MQTLIYSARLDVLVQLFAQPTRFDWRLLLVRDTYRPEATHAVVDDATDAAPAAHELQRPGYQRQPLSNVSLVRDRVGRLVLLADPVEWRLGAGEPIAGAVLYQDVGVDALNPLVAFYPLVDQSGGVRLEWAEAEAGGVLVLEGVAA
ncbi:hypothetical protein [Candidatus Nitrospira bockiana]